MAKRKPGKYEEVLKQLPKLPDELRYEESAGQGWKDYCARIDNAKVEDDPAGAVRLLVQTVAVNLSHEPSQFSLKTRTTSALAAAYERLRYLKEDVAALEKAVNLRITAAEKLMEAAYEAEDVRGVSLGSGGKVEVRPEPYGRIEDKEKLRLWCLDNGLEKALAINWQTAGTIAKERLLEGLSTPDGMALYARPKYVWTKP